MHVFFPVQLLSSLPLRCIPPSCPLINNMSHVDRYPSPIVWLLSAGERQKFLPWGLILGIIFLWFRGQTE